MLKCVTGFTESNHAHYRALLFPIICTAAPIIYKIRSVRIFIYLKISIKISVFRLVSNYVCIFGIVYVSEMIDHWSMCKFVYVVDRKVVIVSAPKIFSKILWKFSKNRFFDFSLITQIINCVPFRYTYRIIKVGEVLTVLTYIHVKVCTMLFMNDYYICIFYMKMMLALFFYL